MSWAVFPAHVNAEAFTTASTFKVSNILIGVGNDVGYVLLQRGSTWTIVANTNHYWSMTVDSTELILQPSLINDNPWWKAGTAVFYKSIGAGWVYSTSLTEGYEPIQYAESSVYYGDEYYSCTSLPTTYGTAVSLTAHGSLYGGADKSVELYATPRWESTTQYGVYTAAGGSSGTKVIGNPTWKSEVLKRGDSSDSNGRYTYYTSDGTALAWDTTASAYVLGTYGDATGWHQTTTAPTVAGSYTLTFTVPEGSTVTGDDIVGVWDSWVGGTGNTYDIQIAEVAVMR